MPQQIELPPLARNHVLRLLNFEQVTVAVDCPSMSSMTRRADELSGNRGVAAAFCQICAFGWLRFPAHAVCRLKDPVGFRAVVT